RAPRRAPRPTRRGRLHGGQARRRSGDEGARAARRARRGPGDTDAAARHGGRGARPEGGAAGAKHGSCGRSRGRVVRLVAEPLCMTRRALIGTAIALAVVAPAAADDVQRKHEVDARIAKLNEQVATAHRKEGALKSQIADLGGQIRVLESRVGDISTRLAPLERELVLRELKLNRLDALFRFQSDRFRFLRAQYAIALARLNRRIVAIYESPQPAAIDLALSSASFSSFLDSQDYVSQIGLADERIANAVGTAKTRMRFQLVR